MVARLPYGLCSLDLHGRVGFANAAAAELLGVPVSRLLGTQLWAAVPWLNDPVYEDRYRAALISQHVHVVRGAAAARATGCRSGCIRARPG